MNAIILTLQGRSELGDKRPLYSQGRQLVYDAGKATGPCAVTISLFQEQKLNLKHFRFKFPNQAMVKFPDNSTSDGQIPRVCSGRGGGGKALTGVTGVVKT